MLYPNVFAIRPKNNPKLFSSSPELINGLVMEAQYLKSIYTVTRKMDANLIGFGKELITLIKKEYNLK